MELEHGDQRQRDIRHLVAEQRHGLPEPETPELDARPEQLQDDAGESTHAAIVQGQFRVYDILFKKDGGSSN
jgi:hypothetical protein